MPEKKSERLTPAKIVIALIGLLFIFVLGRLLPTWSTVSRDGVEVLCIFIGVLVLVGGLNQLIWPVLVASASLIMYGITDASSMFANLLGTSTVMQVIMCWILAGALQESGATDVIAKWLLTRKMFKGRGYLMLVGILLVFYLCGAVTSQTPGTLLAFAVWSSMRSALKIEKNSKHNVLMLISLFLSANAGGSLIPFKGLAPASIKMFESVTGFAVNNGHYVLSFLILHVAYFVILGLAIFFLCREDVRKMGTFDMTTIEGFGAENIKFNKRQLFLLLGFVAGLLYSVVGSFLPAGAFTTWFNSITQAMWFVLVAVVLSWIRVDGAQVLNLEQAFKKYTLWGLLILTAFMMYLGTLLSADAQGIKSWLLALLGPLFGGMPFPVFCFLSCLCVFAVTNVFSNFATMVIFFSITGPIMSIFVEQQGVSITPFYILISGASNKAYLTYAACGTAPLLVGHEDMSNKKLFSIGLVPGAVYLVVSTIVCTALCYIL